MSRRPARGRTMVRGARGKRRRPIGRVTAGLAALLLPGAVVVGGTVAPGAALAATACTVADRYAHHTVGPASATGGAAVAGAKFGAAGATGDFNKDGFADVAVGAPGDVVGGVAAGSVSVFRGAAGGIGSGTRLTQSNIDAGNEAGDRFGAALAVGDFNKDGYADLAVGSPGEAVGSAAKSGAIAVFAGSSSGLSAGKFLDQTLGGGADEANDAFGTALAVGDFNGDGYADLAIGVPGEAPGEDPAGGSVNVYKGSSSGLVAGWTVQQDETAGTIEAGDEFGAALAAGNVTGSGHADLVIGAPGEAPGSDPADSGSLYIMPGAADGQGTGFTSGQETNGGTSEAGDRYGAALAVGNFDKDGYADIAVGVPGEAPGSNPAAGSIAIIPGASSKLGTSFWVQENQAGEPLAAGDKFGAALATGDVDADGYADLLVGAAGKDYGSSTNAGVAYLFRGQARRTGTTVSLWQGRRLGQTDVSMANETSDAFGAAVTFGDITGDGKADAVVGASGEASGSGPSAGVAVQLAQLAPTAATSVAPEAFTPTGAMQATPLTTGGVGTLEYVYSDNIGRLLHGHQTDPDNFGSVQWTVISGTEAFSGQPGLVEQADGRLQIFGHAGGGTASTITQATKSPAVWAEWNPVGGAIKSHIGVARQADGRVVAFAVDPAGELWAMQQTEANGAHRAWISLGITGFAGTPVPVAVSGGIQLFALDATGVLRTALFANGTLSGCTGLSDPGLTATPAVVVYPGSKLRVFVRDADGSILTKKQDDAGVFPEAWTTVAALTAAGSPAALISPTSGKTEVVVRGTDGGIYNTGEVVQGSGTWRDWTKVTVDWEPAAATDPTVFSYTNVNGYSWAFVFRTTDNLSRVYTLSTSPGLAAAQQGTEEADETASEVAPTFTGATLPAPPR